MDLGAAKEDGKNNGSKGKGSKGAAKKEDTAEDANDAEGGLPREKGDGNGSKNAPGGKGARRDGEGGGGLGVKDFGDVRLRRWPLTQPYRGTSLIRNRTPRGLHSRPTRRAPGGGEFFMSEVPLYTLNPTMVHSQPCAGQLPPQGR